MKTIKLYLFIALAAILCVSAATAEEKSSVSAPPGPTVVYQAKFPFTLNSAEYDLLTVIMDFPSAAGVPKRAQEFHCLEIVCLCAKQAYLF